MKQENAHLKNVKVDEVDRTLGKCLVWFYSFPRAKIGLTDLSKSIKSSKTATKQVVEHLIQIQFLNREVIGNTWLLSVNQKHPYFITKKISYNLNIVYESGILEAIYDSISSPRAIILFGSYRWGTDDEESDIDIAIEVIGNEDLRVVRLGVIGQLGYRKNVPVNLHVFSRNKIDSNLFGNIANGIVLEGFLETRI